MSYVNEHSLDKTGSKVPVHVPCIEYILAILAQIHYLYTFKYIIIMSWYFLLFNKYKQMFANIKCIIFIQVE
jgi:hypothetical protein